MVPADFTLAAAVCRDTAGSLLIAWTKRFPPGSPLWGEAKAALFPAQEASFLEKDDTIIFEDNLTGCSSVMDPSTEVS